MSSDSPLHQNNIIVFSSCSLFVSIFSQKSPLVRPAGADVLSQAQDEASILYEASSSGDPEVVGLLLDFGADANVAKQTGHLPLHRVAHRGHLQYMLTYS